MYNRFFKECIVIFVELGRAAGGGGIEDANDLQAMRYDW